MLLDFSKLSKACLSWAFGKSSLELVAKYSIFR